jgi:hypothetical protein
MVRLSTLISELNPEAPQVCVQRGRVPWQFVQQLSHGSPPAASPATPPAEISVCTLEGDWADRPRLRSAVDKLGARLLRLKGIVDFGQGSVLVESVFGSYEETSVSHPATSPGVTAIGWNIEAQQLRATLAPCIRSTSKLVTFR